MALFLINPELYAGAILPLLIFLARVCDVTMETVRIVFISRGIRALAAAIAFFEIVIWLLAVEVVMNDLANIANFFAFALGFAAGTYVGLMVEEKLSLGMVILLNPPLLTRSGKPRQGPGSQTGPPYRRPRPHAPIFGLPRGSP